MPFGAWSPLPLRLGADPQQGWSSQAQSRLAADLPAVKRTVPLAHLTYDTQLFQVVSYTAQHGTGPGNAPTYNQLATGHFGFIWQRAYQAWDETYYGWKIRAVEVTCQGAAPVVATWTIDPNATYNLEVWCSNLATSTAANPIVEITIWGDWLPDRQIGDYDGATDKSDSLTEGDSSYCYDWFTELQAMRGSAYSTSAGHVDAENFAIARQLGALSRNAEKLEANSIPGTSDEKLETWVDLLGIPVRLTDQRWQIRQRAEAKLKAATSKAQPSDIDDAVRTLLGAAFVAAHRITGTSLSAATPLTFWPTVNPGPASYSLGGGAWISDRSFYWIEVQRPANASDADFKRLMDIDLFELLDQRLPAHMTFAWATSDGFLADISLLDFDAVDP